MSFILQEIPVESLRNNIQIITGDNSVLISSGNAKMSSSSVASCRFASELTFKPIAVCFLRPQRGAIRFLEKNEYFTLSYFSPQFRHVLTSFGSGATAEKIVPSIMPSGNVYYDQAELVFECRKVTGFELILSSEIQAIMATEKKRSIYPGNEAPRMFVGEILKGWQKVIRSLASGDPGKLLLPEASRNKFLTSGNE